MTILRIYKSVKTPPSGSRIQPRAQRFYCSTVSTSNRALDNCFRNSEHASTAISVLELGRVGVCAGFKLRSYTSNRARQTGLWPRHTSAKRAFITRRVRRVKPIQPGAEPAFPNWLKNRFSSRRGGLRNARVSVRSARRYTLSPASLANGRRSRRRATT